MKILDLYRICEIMEKLSYEQHNLSEQGIYVYFLGNSSNYYTSDFESFLEYYSFKVEKDRIVVYNDDNVPYEDYSNDDYSYVPICLLSFSAEQIKNWIKEETEKQLKEQEESRLAMKENIKIQIKLLQKQLDQY